MWTYHPELLARPVPRYTSFPTAAEFAEDVGSPEQSAGLAAVGDDDPISLYVHIPYCRQICWYCGCNTGAANRSGRLAKYLERLGQEIALASRLLDGRGRVARVSFGGGSPNAIAPEQFSQLARRLRDSFDFAPGAVWSVEIDPRGFDEPFAEALASEGFANASLGVQTFDPAIQAAIGRVQPHSLIERSTGLLRRAGITSLNLDLMYGLPGQSLGALVADLEGAVALGADRLAVFGYAHVPHLIPRQRRIDASALPDPGARFAMAAHAHERLTAAGYRAVGFDHFARSGDPLSRAAEGGTLRRNFQGFTDDPCDTLIGLGASAISRFAGALVQNEKNSGRYALLVGNGRLAGARGIATPPLLRHRGRLIEHLLCQGSADLGSLPDRAAIADRLAPFAQRGLLAWEGNRLEIDRDARPYARAIAAALDPWRQVTTKSFSSAI